MRPLSGESIGFDMTQINKVLSGDQVEFGNILNLLRPGLTTYAALRKTPEEDIYQITCRNAWGRINTPPLPRFEDPRAFRGWVYRIAHNATVDYSRSKNNRNLPLRETEVDRRDTIADVDSELTIAQWLSVLKTNQAIAVRRRFIEGYTPNEIAQELGMTYGGARTLLHRALRNLKEYLESERYFDA